MSDVVGYRDITPFDAPVIARRREIERLTGSEPGTCPWRAFYDPLVKEVVAIVALGESGLAAARLGEDPPAIVLDAIEVFVAARNAVVAHDMRERQEEARKRDRRR